MNYEEMRQAGTRKSGNRTYTRQDRIKHVVFGKMTEVSFALNLSVMAHYAVISITDLQPSHIGGAENPLHFIPEAQPRNRAASVSGQAVPELIAQNLRPTQLMFSGTAYTGAPVVNARGEVIQGSGRSMSLKTYFANDPKDLKGYKFAIEQEAECFGLDSLKVSMFDNQCALVRMVDTDDDQAIILGQFTQSDLEAVASKATQVKSRVGRIEEATKTAMVNELLSVDDGSRSLAELIRGSRIFKLMIKRNVLRADELEIYTGSRGEVNADGVKFVSDLLLGLVFQGNDVNTPDIFRQLPASTQAAIEKSVLYLVKVPENLSINREFSESILSTREYIQSGYKDVTSWTKQVDFFDYSTPAEKYSALALKLTELYTSARTQKEVVDKFRLYSMKATPSENSLF